MIADPHWGVMPLTACNKNGINNCTEILSKGHETNRILKAQDYGYKKNPVSCSIKPVASV